MKLKTGWNLLRQRYCDRGIVLVLGAGVSIGSSIPDWAGLLSNMASILDGEGGKELADRLIKAGWSLPAIASWLDYTRNDNRLRDICRRALYRECTLDIPADSTEKRTKLVRTVERTNATMRAVAALCAAPENGSFVPNRRIAAVVNFNLDSVFRSFCRAKYRQWLFRTVETAATTVATDRIPIYHMHGFIPFAPSSSEPPSGDEQLVLTEQQYFDFFNRPNSIFNYTFLYLLREYNCVFIGMSMKDENIRRLLHYSTAERRSAKLGASPTKGEPPATALRHFAIMRRNKLQTLNRATEVSLRGIGTRTLWIDDFVEIATRFEELYTSAGDDWASVY